MRTRPKVVFPLLLTAIVASLLGHAQRADKSEPVGAAASSATNSETQKGATAVKPATPATPALTAEQQKQFEAGKAVYEMTCLSCHQPHGLGQEGLAPPLVGSHWTTGSVQRLVRIVIQGMRGPIHVNNQIFELDMPSMAVLEDEQIAAALTYVRREWGHTASPVNTATVKQIREATAQRVDAWTEEELLKLP